MFLWDLRHCFVKHSALRYSSIRPFTMDRLQISEKYKSISRPSQTRLSKHTNTDENMCKGIKGQMKGGCNGTSLIFVLQCQNHAKHYHEIRRKQSVQPSKPRKAIVLSNMDGELYLKIISPRGQCNFKNGNVSLAVFKWKSAI